MLPIDDVVTSFYLRLQVADQTGVLARITGILAEHASRSTRCCSANRRDGEEQTDVIILTHDTVEGEVNAAIATMQALPTVLAPIVRIRKEELLLRSCARAPQRTSGRAARAASAASPRSCSRASRPTAAFTCRSAIRRSTPRRSRAGAACRIPISRSR